MVLVNFKVKMFNIEISVILKFIKILVYLINFLCRDEVVVFDNYNVFLILNVFGRVWYGFF